MRRGGAGDESRRRISWAHAWRGRALAAGERGDGGADPAVAEARKAGDATEVGEAGEATDPTSVGGERPPSLGRTERRRRPPRDMEEEAAPAAAVRRR